MTLCARKMQMGKVVRRFGDWKSYVVEMLLPPLSLGIEKQLRVWWHQHQKYN